MRPLLTLTLALMLSACAPSPPPVISPSSPEVVKLRTEARKVLTAHLDQAVRTAGVTKELGHSGLDRCRRGDDDPKNEEPFSAKCRLSLHWAYAWNGDVNAFLDRFRGCPGAAETRDYWREFGGKADPQDGSRTYDVGDLPELVCDEVTIQFGTSTTREDPDLLVIPGAEVWDEDGGMYDPYYWAPEGKPWLAKWKRSRDRHRFLVVMDAAKDYSLVK